MNDCYYFLLFSKIIPPPPPEEDYLVDAENGDYLVDIDGNYLVDAE
jgi:hypothetical protein